MGLLVDGVWQDRWYDTSSSGGRFVRQESKFRHWITANGEAGDNGDDGFEAASGRYHLYVSLACPWAHRCLIMRKLKGLDEMIGVSVVHWLMGDEGWTFETGPGATGDRLHGLDRLHQLYTRADPTFTGRVTVPVVWDTQRQTIVNNESAEILRMFTRAFDVLGAVAGDYYPSEHRSEIDQVNERIYDTVNNGVYKCGFATSQDAYEEAFVPLFETLDWLEARLDDGDYLVGNRLTEADIRLYTTLVRFDPVYVGHFKCNLRRIADYPNLQAYLGRLYSKPAFHETTDFEHIKRHYYASHETINPSRIVPLGPALEMASGATA
ncbi:MAG: glutathione S-transferase family protein [Geminicoccaceae bacterium]